jgi:hypothetical protein
MVNPANTELLADTILAGIARLQAATHEYREALAAAAEAVCIQYAQQREVEIVEATVRMDATLAVVGAGEKRTAPERDALIAHCIATHPRLREVRDDAMRLRERVEGTRMIAAVADQAQKALRAELAALRLPGMAASLAATIAFEQEILAKRYKRLGEIFRSGR